MIFDNSVTQSIVNLLIQYQTLTMSEILFFVQEKDIISQAQLYRVVEKMIDKQILIKQKKKIGLNSIRVRGAYDITEKMMHSLEKQDHIKKLKIGEKQRITSPSLQSIDGLYGDVYTRILEREKPKTLYHYQSHAYYPNAFHETEKQFWSSLSIHNMKQVVLYGNDTYLDKRGKEFIEKNAYANVICHEHKDFPLEGYMLVVIGNYIVDLTMSPIVTKTFASFFDSMTSKDLFDQKVFRSVFYQKEKCHIVIDHNPERAAVLSRKISTFVTRKMKGL